MPDSYQNQTQTGPDGKSPTGSGGDAQRPNEEKRSFADANLRGLPPTSPGGQMEHQDPAHADDLRKVQEAGGHWELGGDKDDNFNAGTVEANRSIEQGNGVGEAELNAQADANSTPDIERFGQTSDQDRDASGRKPDAEQD